MKFKRWIEIGTYCPEEIRSYAIKAGMTTLDFYKPGLCVYYSIELSGTKEQMKETEQAWTKANIPFKTRKPKEVFY